MARIVTFDKDGVSKISDYSGSNKTNAEIEKELHQNSYRENLIKLLRQETGNKPLNEVSDNSLGYALEKVVRAKTFSSVDRIEFHAPEKTLKNFGIK